MKNFRDYLAESARAAEAPITEDIFDFELPGCLIESEVIEHTEDSITVVVDEYAMEMLDNLGMLEAEEEDFPLMNPQEKFTLDNPKIIKVIDQDEDNLTGATDRQTGMLKAITGSQVIWKQPNTWASAQDSARVMGYILQYVGDDNTFNSEYQGRLPRKEPMGQAKGDLPTQNISPMAEMLRLAGLSVEEDDVEETIKPGTKVKIHAPGKDYHDQVGHVGEIRRGLHNKAPKTYTVDYGDRKSVQLDKKNIKVHKEVDEAEYQGRKVPLGKPMRGDVKKFKVYVKDPKTGNVKKVNFGDPNMRIKKSNPARRKSFRARHNCANPGPRTKARYWSCRKW